MCHGGCHRTYCRYCFWLESTCLICLDNEVNIALTLSCQTSCIPPLTQVIFEWMEDKSHKFPCVILLSHFTKYTSTFAGRVLEAVKPVVKCKQSRMPRKLQHRHAYFRCKTAPNRQKYVAPFYLASSILQRRVKSRGGQQWRALRRRGRQEAVLNLQQLPLRLLPPLRLLLQLCLQQ